MFTSTHHLVLLDDLRVPYDVEAPQDSQADGEVGDLRLAGDGRAVLRWPAPTSDTGAPDLFTLDGVPLLAAIDRDPWAAQAARDGWRSVAAVEGRDGSAVAHVWEDADGTVALPFDPNLAIAGLRMERYRERGGRGGSRLMRTGVRAYYRLRPLIPRSVQLALRRRFAALQSRSAFPRWPMEPALHDLSRHLYTLIAGASRTPVPWIAPWPAGFDWAVVLTHDVETAAGYANMARLRQVEEAAGFRSSWNFVPRRYAVQDEMVAELTSAGFEVGVHGLYHDGRDLESLAMIEQRLPEMRDWAQRWGAVGFRAPATQRRWEWMDRLGFAYDSSYADTAPYEPQPGGSASWLPFLIGDTVELPITLEQDHTLFVILGRRDAAMWRDKAERLRERGGMALVLTHPDYFTDEPMVDRYRELLTALADDRTAWRVLPRDVAAWWRRRSESTLVPDGEGWQVAGPAAAEAAVMLTAPR